MLEIRDPSLRPSIVMPARAREFEQTRVRTLPYNRTTVDGKRITQCSVLSFQVSSCQFGYFICLSPALSLESHCAYFGDRCIVFSFQLPALSSRLSVQLSVSSLSSEC